MALQENKLDIRRLQKVALRARVFTSFMDPLMNMVNNLGLTVVACAGGWLAVIGMASTGEIAAFINYASRLGCPYGGVSLTIGEIRHSLAHSPKYN